MTPNSSDSRIAVAMRLTAISRPACSCSKCASFVVTLTVSCSEVALGMEARTAVPVLTKLLADRDPRVRRWAVAALGEIAAPETVAPLSKVLTKDPDPGVRIEAAFRLGKFGGEAARPALTAALKDANTDVRRLANAALKELAGGSPS